MQRLAEDAQQAIGRRDFPRAAALLGQLVGQSPRDHGAWYWLAFVHVRMGQPELALPAIQTAVTLDKRNPEYHNLAGVERARQAIASGAAKKKLDEFVAFTRGLAAK